MQAVQAVGWEILPSGGSHMVLAHFVPRHRRVNMRRSFRTRIALSSISPYSLHHKMRGSHSVLHYRSKRKTKRRFQYPSMHKPRRISILTKPRLTAFSEKLNNIRISRRRLCRIYASVVWCRKGFRSISLNTKKMNLHPVLQLLGTSFLLLPYFVPIVVWFGFGAGP